MGITEHWTTRKNGDPLLCCDKLGPKINMWYLGVYNSDAKEWQNLCCREPLYNALCEAAKIYEKETGDKAHIGIRNGDVVVGSLAEIMK